MEKEKAFVEKDNVYYAENRCEGKSCPGAKDAVLPYKEELKLIR